MAVKRYGAEVEVVSTGTKYHTWADWGLIITNGDTIGDPEQETNYITVPGRSNLLDASEILTNAPVFTGRKLAMHVKHVGTPGAWDITVSTIRNLIEGKQVKIRFDNDRSHYWLGRINIKEPGRTAGVGAFTLSAYVDAYKHDTASSQEQMKWDDVNFLTDCFRYIGTINVDGSYTLTIPKGDHAVVPTIAVSNITSETFTMTALGKTYTLVSGTNRFPDLKVCGASNVTLNFSGTAKAIVNYRGESL